MESLETEFTEKTNDLNGYGFLWILYLLPILATFGFIKVLGVDVPLWVDQWSLVDLFNAIAQFNLPSILSKLWELNNNHRMIFPKLIFATTAFLSNWNIMYELYLSFCLATVSFFILYKLSERTSQTQSIFLFHSVNLITCLLIFSWVQYINWLWGFQIALYLINFCVIFAIFILIIPTFTTKKKLKIAATFCLIASFSSAQGLMSWLALIPSITTLEGSKAQKIKRFILWLLLFLGSSFIYSIQYRSISIADSHQTVTFNSNWDKFRVYIHFFFNVLAAPLTGSSFFAWILGFLLISCFIFLFFNFWVERPSIRHPLRVVFLRHAAAWLSIGLFSILCSVLMTIGRADLGADYGLTTSRYTTHSILLIIAIIHLLNLHLSLKPKNYSFKTGVNKILAYSFTLGLITSLIWVRSAQSLTLAQVQVYEPNRIAQQCLYLVNYLDLENSQFFQTSPANCFVSMTPSTVELRKPVNILQKIRLRNFAKDIPFIEEPEEIHGFISSPWTTERSLMIPIGGTVRIDGWSVFPHQLQQPQLVFLSRDENQFFFANAAVNLPSPDVVEFLNSDHYQNSRWDLTFSSKNLTPGENIIKAWVYDPTQKQFMKISGEIQVIVELNENT